MNELSSKSVDTLSWPQDRSTSFRIIQTASDESVRRVPKYAEAVKAIIDAMNRFTQMVIRPGIYLVVEAHLLTHSIQAM